ncbi:MAG TPA: hypothetical protein VHW95_07910 [Steroidobacteraceae bacterium]|jgi:hypothetical protein|nr:hypothetical protein [Steroidobacteraceae bacterium]
MNEHLVLALWFGLGVALQALLLIRGDWNWGRLALCVGFGAFGMLPGKHEHVYEPFLHILFSMGFFAFMYALRFKNDLLPVISEKVLLSYSLIFWFAFFSYFYKGTAWDVALAALLLVPTGATVFIAVHRPGLSFAWKLALYTWFLTIVVSLGLFQFPFQHLSIFLSPEKSPWLNPLDCVVAGMAFLYLAVNMAYLFELIPIPGKNQSWADRMKQWHELTSLMTVRFEDEPMHRLGMLLIVVQGIVLLAVYYFHWVSAGLAINLFIVLPSILPKGNNSAKIIQERKSLMAGAVENE